MSQQAGVRWNVIVLSLVALLASACGPTTPSSSSPCVSKGFMSAQVDGVQWVASCVVVARVDPSGYIDINGTDNFLDVTRAQNLGFVVFATQPGTYLLGVPSPVGMGSHAALSAQCQPVRRPVCKTWGVAPCCGGSLDGGSGLITITELTAAGASGTFSFNLVPGLGGATGVKVVTNGAFNVTF